MALWEPSRKKSVEVGPPLQLIKSAFFSVLRCPMKANETIIAYARREDAPFVSLEVMDLRVINNIVCI